MRGRINKQSASLPGEVLTWSRTSTSSNSSVRTIWDATMSRFGSLSKSAQAIAVEWADYSKRAFEQGTAATEKLSAPSRSTRHSRVQSDYVKSAYEGFVAESSKLAELTATRQRRSQAFEGHWSKAGHPQ